LHRVAQRTDESESHSLAVFSKLTIFLPRSVLVK
jgi:hypothetical protein